MRQLFPLRGGLSCSQAHSLTLAYSGLVNRPEGGCNANPNLKTDFGTEMLNMYWRGNQLIRQGMVSNSMLLLRFQIPSLPLTLTATPLWLICNQLVRLKVCFIYHSKRKFTYHICRKLHNNIIHNIISLFHSI